MKNKWHFIPGYRIPWYLAYRLSLPMLYCLTLASSIILIIIWYYGFYVMYKEYADRLTMRISSLRSLESLHSLRTKRELLEKAYQRSSQHICSLNSQQLLHEAKLDFLYMIQSNNNVFIEAFKSGALKEHDNFMISNIYFTFEVDFTTLMLILDYKSKLLVAYEFPDVSITRKENGTLQVSGELILKVPVIR